jgi:hypothetical protein
MKKAKVDRIIRRYQAEALARGRATGVSEGRAMERQRWEALLPVPGDQQVTWLHEPPKSLRYTLAIFPRSGRVAFPSDFSDMAYRYEPGAQRLEFEAVPMALSLASGHQIRWFHWKPRGPYPVSGLAVLR